MNPKGYMTQMILSELEDAVGRDNVSTRETDKIVTAVDLFWIPRMWADRGQYPATADVIVRPGTTEEVAKVLVIANYYKIPVTTWGGGSGSQGGALAVTGGIILDTKRMNKVVEYDPDSMTVTVETGMNFQQLEWYANEHGHSLMHYPSSITCGTVGGFIAHNGIGVLSTRYGKIDDMCLSMEVVLPNGSIIHTLPIPKHSSGPDLNAIFLGAEGTFGVVTKATFRLFEMPEVRKFRAFLFPDLTTGIAVGREILKKMKPSIMRLYDEAETASIIKKILGVSKTGAFMNLALDGLAEVVAIEERIMIEICKKYGGMDLGPEYGEKWWDSRVTFFFPPHALDLPLMHGTMDSVATFANIEKIYWAMKHAVEDNFPDVRFIAHFSHWYEWGCIIYDRFIMEKPPADPEEALRLHNQIWYKAVRAALANGGVVNDHHGVGLKLGKLMKEQYGPTMQVLEGIKKALDPNGIMNPFKMGV
ncbi:MAG: FAD-binding oxidoreductase [Methylobacteriaceae bacterium]|jgi:alkyldihydroxyacetonephosphate synthase|nr:FAD-binding oxidoreductase [Methylobacteriaceae bacterium]